MRMQPAGAEGGARTGPPRDGGPHLDEVDAEGGGREEGEYSRVSGRGTSSRGRRDLDEVDAEPSPLVEVHLRRNNAALSCAAAAAAAAAGA